MQSDVSGQDNQLWKFETATTTPPPPTPLPGSLVKAVNVNGGAVTVGGVNFQAESASGLTVSNGSRYANQNAQLTPATDAVRLEMIRSSVWNSSGTMNINLPIANGNYQVYLYTWEDNQAMNFQLAFEGAPQGGAQSTGAANTWKRLGPFAPNVSDGNLTITATGGHFMLSGIEVYQAGMTPTPQTIKIMPLGDSITDGYNAPGGYRIRLSELLKQSGRAFDFVGSQRNGPAELEDKEHQGHSGWLIESNGSVQGISNYVEGWVGSAAPDVVLLMIGTNDVIQAYNLAQAPTRLMNLIAKIRNRAPAAKIFVANLFPIRDSTYAGRLQTFNSAIRPLIDARIANGEPITFVEMNQGFSANDTADGVHPSRAAYDRMGERWKIALDVVGVFQ